MTGDETCQGSLALDEKEVITDRFTKPHQIKKSTKKAGSGSLEKSSMLMKIIQIWNNAATKNARILARVRAPSMTEAALERKKLVKCALSDLQSLSDWSELIDLIVDLHLKVDWLKRKITAGRKQSFGALFERMKYKNEEGHLVSGEYWILRYLDLKEELDGVIEKQDEYNDAFKRIMEL